MPKLIHMPALNKTLLLLLLGIFLFSCQPSKDQETIKQEILDHGQTIRDAFAAADIEQIKALHHPEVIKALGYDDIKNNREEVIDGIRGTLEYFQLEFIKNEVENILIQDDLAIEQTQFSIKGTPKDGGDPFEFSGRTMVTYVRYEDSPTGWATIREIIQLPSE